MELKKALEIRKTEDIKQEKDKSGIMTLEEAFELRKAKKYVKRTGSPGSYKYYYRDEAGKLLAPGAKEQVSGRVMRQKEKEKVISDNVKQAIQKIAKDTNLNVKQIANKFALPERQVKEILSGKEKKPVSSKKYMKEHAGDIKKEADELKRMSDEDFKRKKEKYDKKKKKGKEVSELRERLRTIAPGFSDEEINDMSRKELMDAIKDQDKEMGKEKI